jgi:hypothetical protein
LHIPRQLIKNVLLALMPYEFADGSLIPAARFMRMLTAAKFLPTRQEHALSNGTFPAN